MSYNTRRTGVAAGRQAPTTQVNYHQQPNRTASGNTAQQNRSANPGYSTTQQPVTYNSAAQPAYSTPAYTTTPPMPPAQPKPAPPAQQQQQAAPTPPATPAAKQQPVSTTTPNLKQEPVTPADTPKAEATENGESGGGAKLPFWKRRQFTKVSNKVRRARQNAKLRRILNPKNALTFLNELRPGTGKFIVREDPGWGYVATVEVDGKTFTGHGLGASKAKVAASEKALKHLLLEQLAKSQQAAITSEVKEDSKAEEESMETEEQEGEEPKAKKPKRLPEDEVPWGSLAAFALHKLFSEWQQEGSIEAAAPLAQTFPTEKYDEEYVEEEYFARRPPVPPEFGFRGRGYHPYPARGRGFGPYPAPRGPPPPGYGPPPPGRRLPPPPAPAQAPFGSIKGPQIPIGAAPMKKIPEDANQRHPVMLLNQLKPHVIYNESREGEQPRVTFVITIDIDGKQYVGRGKNKKEAKKQAAKAALAPMGIIYSEED